MSDIITALEAIIVGLVFVIALKKIYNREKKLRKRVKHHDEEKMR